MVVLVIAVDGVSFVDVAVFNCIFEAVVLKDENNLIVIVVVRAISVVIVIPLCRFYCRLCHLYRLSGNCRGLN